MKMRLPLVLIVLIHSHVIYFKTKTSRQESPVSMTYRPHVTYQKQKVDY